MLTELPVKRRAISADGMPVFRYEFAVKEGVDVIVDFVGVNGGLVKTFNDEFSFNFQMGTIQALSGYEKTQIYWDGFKGIVDIPHNPGDNPIYTHKFGTGPVVKLQAQATGHVVSTDDDLFEYYCESDRPFFPLAITVRELSPFLVAPDPAPPVLCSLAAVSHQSLFCNENLPIYVNAFGDWAFYSRFNAVGQGNTGVVTNGFNLGTFDLNNFIYLDGKYLVNAGQHTLLRNVEYEPVQEQEVYVLVVKYLDR